MSIVADPPSASPQTGRAPRLTRAEIKEQTRAAILAAAHASILKRGYQSSSLDQIAEDAGFTKGAIYVHFPNKQMLFLEILGKGLERQVQELEAFAQMACEDRPRFEREFPSWMGRLGGGDGGEDIALLSVELQIEARRNPAFVERFTGMVKRHELGLSTALQHIVTATGAKPLLPPELLASTLISAAQGLALTRSTKIGGQPASIGNLARILVGIG